MLRITLPCLLVLTVTASSTWADPLVVFSGQKFIRKQQESATTLSQSGYKSLISTLLGIRSTDIVDLATSKEIDAVARPSTFERPQALLALQIMAPEEEGWEQYLGEEALHVATLRAGAEAVSSMISSTAGNLDVNHQPLANVASSTCNDACMEDLLTEALEAVGGNYTAGPGVWKGVAQFPGASGEAAVSIPLKTGASKVWAAEMAALRGAAQQLQEKGREADAAPILYDATILSPKLLHSAASTAGPQAQAATAALSAVVRSLHAALLQAHPDKLVTHMVISNGQPALKSGQLSQRRQLLAASTGASPSSETAANSWFVSAAAWISALLFLVFTIASALVLAKMEFKQDSLLYSRAKTE